MTVKQDAPPPVPIADSVPGPQDVAIAANDAAAAALDVVVGGKGLPSGSGDETGAEQAATTG